MLKFRVRSSLSQLISNQPGIWGISADKVSSCSHTFVVSLCLSVTMSAPGVKGASHGKGLCIPVCRQALLVLPKGWKGAGQGRQS